MAAIPVNAKLFINKNLYIKIMALNMPRMTFNPLHSTYSISRSALWIMCFLLLSSCGDVIVEPFIESDQYYSILGYLDLGREEHFVRVTAFRKTIVTPSDPTIDAKVSILDLNNNLQYAFRDSLVKYSNGTLGHIFKSKFKAQPGHKYRLSVTRSDGKITTAETTAPARPEITVEKAVAGPGANGTQIYQQRIFWKGVTIMPHDTEVWYRFLTAPDQPFRDIKVRYQQFYGSIGKLVSGGFELTIPYNSDMNKMEELEIFKPRGQTLGGMAVRLLERDDQWQPPKGIFDPDVLVQPNVMTNVTNGLGFFGVMGQYDTEWVLPDDVVLGLGMKTPKAGE